MSAEKQLWYSGNGRVCRVPGMASREEAVKVLYPVPTARSSLGDYAPFVGYCAIDETRAAAAKLEGKRVLHISSTPYGGGVAELLISMVPLMKDVGLKVDWRVLERDEDFFVITKLLHNSLQGMKDLWVKPTADRFMEISERYFRGVEDGFDYVIVHDPQPVAAAPLLRKQPAFRGTRWIWRCHLDFTDVDPGAWLFLKPMVSEYEAAIFTKASYAPRDLDMPTYVVTPSIDPLSAKNMELSSEVVHAVVAQFGLDNGKPTVVQVSRFDPWKDQPGVIDTIEIARRALPDLQLVLVGSMAEDDPEGFHYFQKTAERARGLDGVFLFTNIEGIGNIGVNAFQRAADVVVQKSTREGFGLTVSEALWKEKPVIGGDVGGIPLQIIDGQNGFLVDSVPACAEKILFLLDNPETREEMGRKGRQWVREHFLTPRNLSDYLRVFSDLG